MVAVGDKGDGRGLCGQGCVFADFMLLSRLSEGCGRPGRPCPRLMHSEPSRLAVVTAFSLKLAMASADAMGGSEHSEHSEHSESAGAAAASEGAGVVSEGEAAALSVAVVVGAGVGVVAAGAGGAGAVSVGVGVAAARIWAR